LWTPIETMVTMDIVLVGHPVLNPQLQCRHHHLPPHPQGLPLCFPSHPPHYCHARRSPPTGVLRLRNSSDYPPRNGSRSLSLLGEPLKIVSTRLTSNFHPHNL